jgi:hypothetical protein
MYRVFPKFLSVFGRSYKENSSGFINGTGAKLKLI